MPRNVISTDLANTLSGQLPGNRRLIDVKVRFCQRTYQRLLCTVGTGGHELR